MSVVGNRSPVSTTTIRPSYSTTVMFLPISPTPPSGRTRRGLVVVNGGTAGPRAATGGGWLGRRLWQYRDVLPQPRTKPGVVQGSLESGRTSVGGHSSQASVYWAQQPVALEHRLDDAELTVVSFNHRQAQATHVVTEKVQRGLDRDRVGS